MKEKDHAHLSRTESDQLPLFQPILKQRKDTHIKNLVNTPISTIG